MSSPEGSKYIWYASFCWVIALFVGSYLWYYIHGLPGAILGGFVGLFFFFYGCYYIYLSVKADNRFWDEVWKAKQQRMTQKEKFQEEFLEMRTAVLKRDNYTCVNCGRTGGELHVHHIIPRSEGGTNNLDNLVTLCERCHSVQDAKGHELIRETINHKKDEEEDIGEEHAGLIASNEEEESEALFW